MCVTGNTTPLPLAVRSARTRSQVIHRNIKTGFTTTLRCHSLQTLTEVVGRSVRIGRDQEVLAKPG